MKDDQKQPAVHLTRGQSRAVDKIAAEKYRMPTIILMENAARAAADLAGQIVSKNAARIQILCGPGNNGGDGLGIARHLRNRGHEIQVLFLGDPAKYKGDAMINWQIIEAMRIPYAALNQSTTFNAELLIDALFGTGLTEPPRPPFGEIATVVNRSGIPVLAIDIPSGLDCDSGKPIGPVAIRATYTITFVAQKIGFANRAAYEYLGELTVADIGCPQECIREALAQ